MIPTASLGKPAETPTPKTHVLWTLSIGFALLAMVVHAIQLFAMLPGHIAVTAVLDFPHSFHAWLLETAAWLLAIICASAAAIARVLARRWAMASALQKAILLGSILVAIQALLALIFWLARNHGPEDIGGLRAAFWLGGEFRIPVLFAVLQLLLAAWLTWQCFKMQRKAAWALSTAIFTYMGFDELFSIHERVGDAVKDSDLFEHTEGTTAVRIGDTHVYVWVLVFLPLVALIGLWLILQFRRLVGTRSVAMLSIAGLIFLGGAMGVETRESNQKLTSESWDHSTDQHLNLLLEETMETLGVTLAVMVFARRRWILMDLGVPGRLSERSSHP